MIAENIQTVRNRIAKVCERTGRDSKDILLLAVSKTFKVDLVKEAVAAGINDFGENYVQELGEKQMQLREVPVRWHFIGHLQSNKAKVILPYVHLIHSLDSVKLAEEIQKRASGVGRVVDVLIEVHTTDEATKFGVASEQVSELARQIEAMDHLRLKGLMTMGPFSDDPDDSRPSFRKLVELKRRLEDAGVGKGGLSQLSMGMSHDFEVAIEEGSTIVRIGTALFGKRSKKT